MAVQQAVTNITLEAAEDLSSAQYFGAVLSSGQAAIAAAGEDAIGVIQNDPDTQGLEATIAIGGVLRVIAGAAFASGIKLATDSAGKFVTATSGDQVLARAVEAATALNDEVAVIWDKTGILV